MEGEQKEPLLLDSKARKLAYEYLQNALKEIQAHAKPASKYRAVDETSIYVTVSFALRTVERLLQDVSDPLERNK